MEREWEQRQTDWEELVCVLTGWFRDNARILAWREEPTPYHVWLSEIMLQQTRVEAVKAYYERFLAALPDIKSLAAADDEQLLKLWEGLGYYSRVRNLKKAAVQVMQEYGGELPADYRALLRLSGIGEYTAGAIASIAFHIPVPAVDGNVLRVISRITGSYDDIAAASTKKTMTEQLLSVMPKERPGDFNQALMELGAMVCIPNGEPLCEQCPVYGTCAARKYGLTKELPVKSPKQARRVEERFVLVLRVRDASGVFHYLIHKRSDKGLLAGLWEWPNIEGNESESVSAWISELLPASAVEIVAKKAGKHIFSHVEWRMRGFLCECIMTEDGRLPGVSALDVHGHAGLPVVPDERYRFVTRRELEQYYALPSAFSTFGEWMVD